LAAACLWLVGAGTGVGQEVADQDEEAGSGIRVRGRLVVEQPQFSVDLAGIEMTLEEMVPAPQLPLPENFQEMTLEQRQKWFQDFQSSDAGKRYQEQLSKADAGRKKFSAKADAEGKFVFEAAFPATFGLFGQLEFESAGKTYLADFFAEVPVGAGVKFLDLGDMPLEIRRILKAGEAAPDLVLTPPQGTKVGTTVALKEFAGKPLLLCFFTADGLTRVQADLTALHNDRPSDLQVLGVNLDAPDDELQAKLDELKLAWPVKKTSGLQDAPVAIDYGILALPGFCLIDAQGKVLLSDDGFFEALNEQQATIRSVIEKSLKK
jgi:peroxiredoxin